MVPPLHEVWTEEQGVHGVFGWGLTERVAAIYLELFFWRFWRQGNLSLHAR